MRVHAIAYTAQPEPGYYRWRRARGAPWTPVVIYRPCPFEPDIDFESGWLDRWRQPVALIDGWSEGDPYVLWPRLHAIARDDYERMLAADIPDEAKRGNTRLADMKPLF